VAGQASRFLRRNPRWLNILRKSVLPVAVALLAGLAVPPVRDLAAATGRAEKLYTSGLSWMKYGQLQYRTQESRRRFLYALIVGDQSERARCIPPIRQADQRVSLTVGKALFLGLNPAANAAIRQFASEWEDYTSVRDDMLALALQGRTAEAVKLEAESGTPAFDKAQATMARVEPMLDAYLSREKDSVRSAFARAAIGLAALFLAMVCFMTAFVWADRKRRSLLASLEESNEALRTEQETERQHSRILELIGSKEPLETVLDAVVAALHRQQPDPATGCAVLALPGLHLSTLVRGLPEELLPALHRFAARAGAGEPVDTCKDELREAARREGFPECRFAPVRLRGTEDVGWIVLFQKRNPERVQTTSVLIHRAQRAAALAIENRRLYEQLAQQAHFDALTELPNRLLFHDRLHQALAHARRHRTRVAILWLDLDGFKRVNDTLGHRAGDALLRLAAQRLQGCVRETDTLARLGGDEFTVVLKDVRDLAAAIGVAEALLEALRKPFRVARHDLSIGASVGVSIYPDHGEDVTAVVKSADIAMYRAKALGKNRVEAFVPAMADAERERLEMEIELRAALANEEFELYYQPQVDVYGRLTGLEALLRWNSRARGMVSPAEFIPVAEATGMIVPLGAWVVRRACLQCREWMDDGLAVPRIAVNVSAVQLAHSDFALQVKQCLEETHLAPERLELEITESSFLSNSIQTSGQVERIRALGVSISIDDFGTGYSSLSYLHRLPVDRLKIDRSFVREINSGEGDTASVVRAIVAMAHSLDLSVVAEGVETGDQLEAIRLAGCDFAQGFYFHRPLAVPAAAHLLARSGATPERHDLAEFQQQGVMENARV
jgi:diguanylate cyclase (GGDEF)-like protein